MTIEEDVPIELLQTVMPEAWLQANNMPSPQLLDVMEKRIGKRFVKVGPDGKIIEKARLIQFEPTNLYPAHDVDHGKVKMRYHVRVICGTIVAKDGTPTHFPKVLTELMVDVEKFEKDYRPL